MLMLMKAFILLMLLLMVISLFSGLFFLYKDRGQGTRTLKALTARISIWVVLFLVLCVGIYTGAITPTNSIQPHWAQPTADR